MKTFLKSEPFESMDRRYFNLTSRMEDSVLYLTEDFISKYNLEMILFLHPE
jgi:hypothetical protein